MERKGGGEGLRNTGSETRWFKCLFFEGFFWSKVRHQLGRSQEITPQAGIRWGALGLETRCSENVLLWRPIPYLGGLQPEYESSNHQPISWNHR